MHGWHVHALAAAMALACVALCGTHTADLRAADELAHRPQPELRVCDLPVVKYPDTREYALHGTPVTISVGLEKYDIEPTADELAYGMRWSREP